MGRWGASRWGNRGLATAHGCPQGASGLRFLVAATWVFYFWPLYASSIHVARGRG